MPAPPNRRRVLETRTMFVWQGHRGSAAIDLRAGRPWPECHRPEPGPPRCQLVGGPRGRRKDAGDTDGWREREGQGRGRGAEEARSARPAHGAVHGPGAGTIRLRVAAATWVSGDAGRRGRGVAGDPGRPAGDQRRPPRRRRAGPGADRSHASHPGAPLPRRLRHLDRLQPDDERSTPSSDSSTR